MSHCEWKPIETAPRDGRFFYVSNNKLQRPMLARWSQEAGSAVVYLAERVQFWNEESATVTHWMPLPPPPEE